MSKSQSQSRQGRTSLNLGVKLCLKQLGHSLKPRASLLYLRDADNAFRVALSRGKVKGIVGTTRPFRSSRTTAFKSLTSGSTYIANDKVKISSVERTLQIRSGGKLSLKYLMSPVMVKKQLSGIVVSIRHWSDPDFTKAESAIVEDASWQLALVLEQSRTIDELSTAKDCLFSETQELCTELHHHRESSLVRDKLSSMRDSLFGIVETSDILQTAATSMIELADADICSIALIDRRSPDTYFCKSAARSRRSVKPATLKHRELCERDSIRRLRKPGGPIRVNASESRKTHAFLREFTSKNGMKSAECVPLEMRSGWLLLTCLGWKKQVHDRSGELTHLHEGVGKCIRNAIETAELYETLRLYSDGLRSTNEDLSVLFDLSRQFSTTFDLERTLEFAVGAFVNRLDVDRAAIFMIDPEDEDVIRMKNAAKPGTGVAEFNINELMRDPEDFFAQVREGRMLIVEDLTKYKIPNKYVRDYFKKNNFKSSVSVPLISRYHKLGLLFLGYTRQHKKFETRDQKLFETFASLIATAMENCRLMDYISGKYRRAGWLSARIFEAQEEERRKISRMLHDEIGAGLVLLKINVQILGKFLASDDKNMVEMIRGLETRLDETISKLRHLTVDLRPPMLDDLGLIPALSWYIDQFKKRSSINVKFKNSLDFKNRNLDREIVIYRIVQESLTNIAKHADAAEAEIRLAGRGSKFELTISDNGRGFNPQILNAESMTSDGFGLLNIRQQVDNRDGEFAIESKPNKGTRLRIRMSWPDE